MAQPNTHQDGTYHVNRIPGTMNMCLITDATMGFYAARIGKKNIIDELKNNRQTCIMGAMPATLRISPPMLNNHN